jgi:hypothetical protein
MSEDKSTEHVQEEVKYETLAEFLENTPPNRVSHISDLVGRYHYHGGGHLDNVILDRGSPNKWLHRTFHTAPFHES